MSERTVTSDSYNCATCLLALASPNAPCPRCLRETGNPWPHLENPLVELVDKPGLGAAMRHAIEQATVARTSNGSTVRQKYDAWWAEQTKKGDPARRPWLTFDAYYAGYTAALEHARSSIETPPCSNERVDDETLRAIRNWALLTKHDYMVLALNELIARRKAQETCDDAAELAFYRASMPKPLRWAQVDPNVKAAWRKHAQKAKVGDAFPEDGQ